MVVRLDASIEATSGDSLKLDELEVKPMERTSPTRSTSRLPNVVIN